MAAGKTAKSILISCGARLTPFDIRELREVMSYDEMELDTLGDRKTALFIIINDTDDSFSFIAALMYSQLKAIYKDNAETIIGNMDARLFHGGSEKTTLKDLSESLGKELMSIDELSVMDGSKCILQLHGVRPFLSDKYDITKHKNYRYPQTQTRKMLLISGNSSVQG